jgi:hypothetical protein
MDCSQAAEIRPKAEVFQCEINSLRGFSRGRAGRFSGLSDNAISVWPSMCFFRGV